MGEGVLPPDQPVRNLLEQLAANSRQGKGRGCEGFMEASAGKMSQSERADLAKVDVLSLRVEGQKGYLLYKDSAGTERAMSVQREGGDWKVASLVGGLGLPLAR
jgi:hypothetical protein